jgi:hypothetical protein
MNYLTVYDRIPHRAPLLPSKTGKLNVYFFYHVKSTGFPEFLINSNFPHLGSKLQLGTSKWKKTPLSCEKTFLVT